MTESSLFGITVNCHPELVSGSGPEEPGRAASERRTKDEIPTRSFVGMTESSLFGITIRCHPELDPGSVPRTNNLDAQRWYEETVFPKDGFMVWDEGPRTALCSIQRVFVL